MSDETRELSNVEENEIVAELDAEELEEVVAPRLVLSD